MMMCTFMAIDRCHVSCPLNVNRRVTFSHCQTLSTLVTTFRRKFTFWRSSPGWWQLGPFYRLWLAKPTTATPYSKHAREKASGTSQRLRIWRQFKRFIIVSLYRFCFWTFAVTTYKKPIVLQCNCIQPKTNKTAMRIDELLQKHIDTELCFALNAFVEQPPATEHIQNCQVVQESDDYSLLDTEQCDNVTRISGQEDFDIRCG